MNTRPTTVSGHDSKTRLRSRGFWLRIAAALSVAIVVGVDARSAVADDDQTDWSTHLRWGLEYDDNPQRLEAHDGQGSMLTRYFASGDITSDVGESARVSSTFHHGGKMFRDHRAANMVLTEVKNSARWWPTDRLSVESLLDLKDRSERQSHRDYTRGGGALRLSTSLGPVEGWAAGGWRFLAYKPSPEAGHRGPQLRAGLRWMVRPDLAIDGSWGRSWRAFETHVLEARQDEIVEVEDQVRSDRYDVWRLSARYQRRVSAQLRLQRAQNRSNSYGQRMRRHSAEIRLTAPVFWEMFVSARAEIQRTNYEDPVLIDDTFMIDDEHRNTLVAAVKRRLVDPWEIEFRTSLFTQEFGVGDDFRRQTFGLAIGVHLDDSR